MLSYCTEGSPNGVCIHLCVFESAWGCPERSLTHEGYVRSLNLAVAVVVMKTMTQTTIFAQNSNNPFACEHCKTKHKAVERELGRESSSRLRLELFSNCSTNLIIMSLLFTWSVWLEFSEVKHTLRCGLNRDLVSLALTSNPSVDPREQGNAPVQLCVTGHPSAHTMSVFFFSPNLCPAYQSL